MSEPSAVLAAVVARLATLLGSDVSVEANPGQFEGKDFVTNTPAAVLVTCVGLPVDHEQDYEPPTANADFAAFVLVRAAEHPKSQGDVAMDLAALVVSHVSRETWSGLAAQRATRVRARNLYSRALKDEGLTAWAVTWSQAIELTPPDTAGVLHRLAEIHTTFAMGDASTPDVSHTQQFPE